MTIQARTIAVTFSLFLVSQIACQTDPTTPDLSIADAGEDLGTEDLGSTADLGPEDLGAADVGPGPDVGTPLDSGPDLGQDLGAGDDLGVDMGVDMGPPPVQAIWARRYEALTNALVEVRAVKTDPQNNIIMAGVFARDVDFGEADGVVSSQGTGEDLVIAKYTPDGDELWRRTVAGRDNASQDRVFDLDVDPMGNVYLGGFFRGGNLEFPAGELSPGHPVRRQILLLKFDANGTPVWGDLFGEFGRGDNEGVAIFGRGEAQGVQIDPSTGDLIACGRFQATLDLGGADLTTNGNFADLWVARFSEAGAHIASRAFGGAQTDEATDCAVDAMGNVFITGNFGGTINFGISDHDTDFREEGAFVVKLDPNFDAIWSRGYSAREMKARAIEIDSNGDALIAGVATGSIDFGSGTSASASSSAFLVKLSGTDGAWVWERVLRTASTEAVHALAIDSQNAVIVGGTAGTSVDLGLGTVMHTGVRDDMYAAKFAADGTPVWGAVFGGDNYHEQTTALAVDSLGDVILGAYAGSAIIDFGLGPLAFDRLGFHAALLKLPR